jgi:2-iminobutanoate/2-iminopropanoate deaminase
MRVLFSKEAPEPIGPYSQGVEVGGLIFLSGQIGLRPDTGEMANGLVEQTRQVMKNIAALLRVAGCNYSSVVKSIIYLKNLDDFAEFNKIYSEYFKETPPARTTLEVSALPRNALIEIDVIARK